MYDVKAGSNSYYFSIAPAFADTVYSIKKSDAPGLAEGDRAYLRMKYFFDAYTMYKPEVSIDEVIVKITRRAMSRKGSFDASLYNSPFSSSAALMLFSDVPNQFAFYDFLWADNETQNIAVKYNKGLNCTPKMTVDSASVNKETGEAVLYFRLYANLENRGWVDSEVYPDDYSQDRVCKILSFNMDWSMIKEELSAEDLAEIAAIDSLTSCIMMVNERDSKKDADGLYIPVPLFTNDKFANGLYEGK